MTAPSPHQRYFIDGATKISAESTGRAVVPDTSHGPNFKIDANGNWSVSSHTLPSAKMIFFPVFVTSRGVTGNTIEYLLDSSRPAIERLFRTAIENGEDLKEQLDPRFILPPERNPEFLLFPTLRGLRGYKDFQLPFLEWTREQVFAAWTGSDRASREEGMASLRWTNKGDKPRYWTDRVYLILDEEAAGSDHEPLAAVAYLDKTSSSIQDLQYIRCDLPVSLRLMVLLESGIRSPDYVRVNLIDGEGVVRYDKYEEWFKPGGMADQDMEP